MSFGREGKITGEELRAARSCPAACGSCSPATAPAPRTSAYRHWLAAARRRRTVPRQAEAVLAGLPGPRIGPSSPRSRRPCSPTPNGPLAFMGHIDLAWTYGFQELDAGATNRPARYMAITRSLLKRDRVGVSRCASCCASSIRPTSS
jgi:hypothetical protein